MLYSKNFLNKIVTIEIDRPIWSVHPKHKNIYYLLNYWFVPWTLSSDGE